MKPVWGLWWLTAPLGCLAAVAAVADSSQEDFSKYLAQPQPSGKEIARLLNDNPDLTEPFWESNVSRLPLSLVPDVLAECLRSNHVSLLERLLKHPNLLPPMDLSAETQETG
jgi:hypothetical protein